jgi:SAM-dependent methyltransferase
MMSEGRAAAARQGIDNVRFEPGAAEDLPFPDASFDLVVTRFSVHHFASPEAAFSEMARVCRVGGRVGVIDIISPEDEATALRYNDLERLRDPTHTRALTRPELRGRIEAAGLLVDADEVREVPMRLDSWLDRTKTPAAPREAIVETLHEELAGGKTTGMRPFAGRDGILFTHVWSTIAAVRVAIGPASPSAPPGDSSLRIPDQRH